MPRQKNKFWLVIKFITNLEITGCKILPYGSTNKLKCACCTAQRVNLSVALKQPGRTWQVHLSSINPEPTHRWEGSQRKTLISNIITFARTGAPQRTHTNTHKHGDTDIQGYCRFVSVQYRSDALRASNTFFKDLDLPHKNKSFADPFFK